MAFKQLITVLFRQSVNLLKIGFNSFYKNLFGFFKSGTMHGNIKSCAQPFPISPFAPIVANNCIAQRDISPSETSDLQSDSFEQV